MFFYFFIYFLFVFLVFCFFVLLRVFFYLCFKFVAFFRKLLNITSGTGLGSLGFVSKNNDLNRFGERVPLEDSKKWSFK